MKKELFEQYKKLIADYEKLVEMANEECIDAIQDQLTDKQYDEVKNRQGYNYVVV